MNLMKYMLAALLVLLMLGLTSFAQEIPQVVVFENFNMSGNHQHIFADIPDMTKWDNNWNDKISSIVVISGTWNFFADPMGAGSQPNKYITLGPGVYPDVTKEGMADNSISQIGKK